MINEELVKRVLAEETDLTDCAADRIEGLEERNKELTLQLLATSGQVADALDKAVVAEAKLAKAVEALHFYADFHEDPNGGPWGINSDDFGTKARAVLAELECEPLGAEFEAVWDANKNKLYEA